MTAGTFEFVSILFFPCRHSYSTHGTVEMSYLFAGKEKKRGDAYIVSLTRLMESVFLIIRNKYEKMHSLQVVKKIVNPQYFNSNNSFLFNHIPCLFPPLLYAIFPSLIKR